jgi:hypothetical protein
MTGGGSWDIWKAVVARWDQLGLSAKFTAHWAKGTSTAYAALNDGEARSGTPFPYCVLEQGTGLRDYRSSHESDSSKTRVTDNTLFQFRLHGDDKSQLIDLCKEIVGDPDSNDGFDNAPLVVEGGSCHLDIQRQTDFSVRESDTEWVWVIPYEIRFEYEQ